MNVVQNKKKRGRRQRQRQQIQHYSDEEGKTYRNRSKFLMSENRDVIIIIGGDVFLSHFNRI